MMSEPLGWGALLLLGVIGFGIAWALSTLFLLVGGLIIFSDSVPEGMRVKRNWLIAACGTVILPLLALFRNMGRTGSEEILHNTLVYVPNVIGAMILFLIVWSILALINFVLIRSWAKSNPMARICLSMTTLIVGYSITGRAILGAAKIL